MNELLKMFVKIEADMSDLKDDFEEVEEKAEEAADSIVEKFKAAGTLLAGAIALDKIFDFSKLAVETAAEFKAIEAQVEQVFGDMVDVGKQTINKLSDEFGILPNRISPYFTSITAKFKGLGFTTEEAMVQAERATKIAADAAAFYDKSLEDAAGSLNSFINGNYEGGEAIGLFASETQMANWAVQQGIVDSTTAWQNLDEATKQATRLEYAQAMYDQSGATGQASREADGYENVMGNLNAAWREFLAVIGSPLLAMLVPILQGVTDGVLRMAEVVQGVIEGYQQWSDKHPILAEMLEKFVLIFGALVAGIILYNTWLSIATVASGIFGAAIALITSPITLVIVAIAGLVAIVATLYNNWSTYGPMLAQVWENIRLWITQKAQAIWTSISTWFSNMWSTVNQKVSQIQSTIQEKFSQAVTTVTQKVTQMYNAVRDWFSKIPSKIRELWCQAQSYLSSINLYSIGSNIIQGLWNGMKDVWGNISGWISEKANSVKSFFTNALSIHSPSRVMRNEVGQHIMSGLLHGMEDTWPKIEKFMGNAVGFISGQDFNLNHPSLNMNSAISQGSLALPQRSKEVQMLEETNFLLRKLLDKNIDLYIDNVKVSEQLEEPLTHINQLRESRQQRLQGGLA